MQSDLRREHARPEASGAPITMIVFTGNNVQAAINGNIITTQSSVVERATVAPKPSRWWSAIGKVCRWVGSMLGKLVAFVLPKA